MSNLMQEEITGREITDLPIQKVIESVILNGLPLAVWRKPGNSEVILCFSLNQKTQIDECKLDSIGAGFLFCPFEVNNHQKNHFIKSDVIIRFNREKPTKIEYHPGVSQSDVEDLLLTNSSYEGGYRFHLPHDKAYQKSTSKDEYIKLVEKAIEEIREGKMTKVVPARIQSIPLKSGFNLVKLFSLLHSSYPSAFVYLTSIPGVGTWIGATPENLISVDKNNDFKTTALAGTQAYSDDMDLADAAWRQKEIEEQAMVSRYIINCFKKIRLREFEELGPRTSKAGNLIHLKTDFIVKLDEVSYPLLPTVMLDLLHPTSATCGMPKEHSLDFLHKNEGFNRAFFSGFIGPNDVDSETNIYVNLRCMQLTGEKSANLYAGAGVTIDSKADKEWNETEMKLDTLLKVIAKV